MTQETHPVTDGRVFCPRAGGEVDIERCLRCRQVVDMELDTTHPYIRCEAPITTPGHAGEGHAVRTPG